MAEDRKEVEGTDEAPLKAVSSLLSHFEHLSCSRNQSPTPGSNDERTSRQRFDHLDDSQPIVRASLDLPRPQIPWTVSGGSENGPVSAVDRSSNPPWMNSKREKSPGSRRFGRPLSMSFRTAPQITPSLTVESPRSPPRGANGQNGGHWPSFNRGNSDLTPTAKPRSRSPPGPVRPKDPVSPSARSVGAPRTSREPSPTGSVKSSSLPPPVNRGGKPKIPAKPANISHLDVRALTPTHEPTHPTTAQISPFSTPPSSPEKLQTKADQPRKSPKISRSLSTTPEPFSLPPPVDRSTRPQPTTTHSIDANSRPPAITSHPNDARELGFTRRNTSISPSKHSRSASHIVSPTRDSRLPEPARKLSDEDRPELRPSLPPRDGPASRRAPRSVGPSELRNPDLPTRASLDLPSRTPRIPTSSRLPTLEMNTQFAPPPRRQTATVGGKLAPDTPQTPKLRQSPSPITNNVTSKPKSRSDLRDSEDEAYPEEAPVSRTDYPDSSQVNRRPPVFKTGPLTIPTRYDTREFDVCGKYVCTTGYLTRVWDLTTGEQIMSISHGETVKAHTVAFKPGTGLEDEGTRLWVGTSVGEIHELDIGTQSIVTSRSYPSRREVIKIYRHKKEMWTLDDEGKLLVWPPDETGTPNLQYSYDHPPDRVARGHTFSMVVGDDLWLATGKEVRVYRPSSHGETFHVLKKPLGANHSGEVTSGTHTTKDGGRVYLGHADGKVTVYSSTDFSCIASVNVSVYKINSLAIVGDYLWAAYKTGMIYVYDVSTNPWTVKKDWHAHESPVCGLVLDPSSLWTMNRLQVVSLGTDNYLRLWDGMLEDDWLETRMQGRDVEYCNFREIRATIVTWNAGASMPRDLHGNAFIENVIHAEEPPELLVFGFQELVDLEDKKITAKSLFLGSKKREHNDKEHMSRQYRVWRDHLAACINNAMPLEESYVLLHTSNLVGLFTCVFIKQKERDRVRNINAAEVKRGMGGLHGNKGALILRFVLDDSSMCFINCHLAAGQSHTAHRNNDIAAILETESLPAEHSLNTRTDLFVNGGDGSMILDHEICILNGDLNYRIDSMSRNVVIDAVRQNNLSKLLERDQLLASKRKNPSFRLRTFTEAPITFAPTYKYDVNSDEYDTSDKKRSPAWCDRILYRGVGKVKQTEYRRHEVRASDHRPVSASFKMRVKSILANERAVVWDACQKEFAKEKRRLACESSIEYLVNVFGMEREQARKVITSGGSSKSKTSGYNFPTTTDNAYLVLSWSQAEGNSLIFDLADHFSQDSPSPIASDHPESPSTSTSTSADLDVLIPSPSPVILQQRDSFSQYTGYSPPPLHPASNGNGVDTNFLSENTSTSVSRLRRRRRRSEVSSSSSSSSASETSEIDGLRDVGSSSARPPLATNVSSAGTRGAQRSTTGCAEGHPPSPKRRRLANMRPNNGVSVTTANGRSDASNGLFSTSSRGKSSVNGKSSNHLHNGQSNTNGSARASAVSSSYFGHDREEVTRILIQGLYDLGYNGAASALTRESGYELESPSVVAFRSAVLDGQWAEAESLLLESFEDGHDASNGDYESPSSWGKLALAETADKNEMLFLLRQQKFLELLEARDLGAALMVLRHELTPLNHNIAQLHALSSLLMSPVEHLRELSGWGGSIALSRELLLSDLSTFISPAVMIPDHRLASLLDQVKSNWVNQCLFHNTAQSPSLYSDHMCDRNAFPRHGSMQLTRHSNEVWYVEFSHDGTKLVTTSKDKSVIIYDATDRFSVIHRFYEHHDAVVFATWSPDDTKLITCSQDKTAKVWDVQTGHCYMTIEHHSDIVTAAAWAPDGESFVTASMDIRAPLCYWGLRSRNPIHVWRDGFRAQDCAITPDGTRLIASDNEDKLYVYDLASRAEEYCLSMKNHITSISVSNDSRFVLLNLRNNQIQLMDIETTEIIRRFDGQKQGEWVIRSRFGGAGENFVVSGSEDSQIYIWHRENGALVEVLEGHTKGCVNAISWNPKNPSMFASAGDDCVVRIWTRDNPSESSPSKGRFSKASDFTRTSALRSTTSQL